MLFWCIWQNVTGKNDGNLISKLTMDVIKYGKVNHQIFQFGDQKSSLDAQIYIKPIS